MKRVCCCFTWIVFIELKFHNLTDLRVRWGDGEFQEMGGGDPSNGGGGYDFEMGG